MDIHIIQPSELDQINEALDEIKEAADSMDITNKDYEGRASKLVHILSAQDRIRYIFAPRYYVFKCIKCGRLHATTEADLRTMLKPCHKCKTENSLVFVDKTTVLPENTTTRSTF